MPSSFTPSLRLTLPVTGENPGTWGDLVNNGITSLVDSSVAGYAAVTMTDANYTLTTANGAADESRKMMLNISGSLNAARNVICPTASKLYFIKNATTGGFAITLKTAAGSGISIPNGRSMVLMCNGTDVVDATDYSSSLNTATLSASSTVSGAGFSAYLASPPAIGGTVAAAGSFTALSYSTTLTGGTGVVALGTNQFYKDASGNIGIGTAAPGSKLDVKGTLRLSGATSGYVGLAPAAAAGSTTYTLPSTDGTSGQVLQTNGTATLSWATPSTVITNFTSNLNTTTPNATVPYVQLLATNAATNVDVAITPKGTGAFSLQVADNSTAGGNKRGTKAVDLQLQRSGPTEVASGANSFAVGSASTASGPVSISLGSRNIANSTNSVVLGGQYGTARNVIGNRVYPAAFGTTLGARQFTNIIVSGDTADAAANYITSDGTGNQLSATCNIVLPDNSAFYIKGTVIAGITGGGLTKSWDINCVAVRGAGASTTRLIAYTNTSIFADSGTTAWNAYPSATLVFGGVNIIVIGQATTNIRWVGNFQVTEMTY